MEPRTLEITNRAGRTTQLEVRGDSVSVGEGAHGRVYRFMARVRLVFRGKELFSKEFPAIIKTSDSDKEPFDPDQMLEEHSLIAKGDPSIKTFGFYRKLQNAEQPTLVMPDLTDNGKNIVISATDVFTPSGVDQTIQNILKSHPAMAQQFAHLDEKSIRTAVLHVCHDAAQKRIPIPSDAFFLILRPDGKFEISVYDFDNSLAYRELLEVEDTRERAEAELLKQQTEIPRSIEKNFVAKLLNAVQEMKRQIGE